MSKRKLTTDDINFLKYLQNEMLTQDTDCEANPRFWTIEEPCKIYNVAENDSDGVFFYDAERCEDVYEGELEKLSSFFIDDNGFKKILNDLCLKCNYEIENDVIVQCDGEDCNYILNDIDDVKDFLETVLNTTINYGCYRNSQHFCESAMFLTKKECKQHLKLNYYHYHKNAHSYAMTAWRSPSMEKLYDILQNVDFDNLNNK